MSVFIEYFVFLRPPVCLRKSLKCSGNLTEILKWWAQWWAHLGRLEPTTRTLRETVEDSTPTSIE